ncbi:MAG: carboxypeptidase regulatory-like domain-containing protein [Pirellulaceae bacterium]|nr:carboxypeptidase regulatory-like domain-containing protein [Pirellulaceae bacterium]
MGRSWMAVALVSAGIGLIGCAGSYQTSDIEETAPVSGVLTYQGKPLEHYQVVFMPFNGSRVGTATTDAEGKFTMGTNDAGDGSPVGEMKVAISFVGPPSTVEAGTELIIDDPSKMPRPKVRIPAKYNDPETSGITQNVPREGVKDLKLDLK